MNFAFLAPVMLGGAALLIAPFLIHRIRRPEREPVRFSSLLFIPDVKKEVIERRRLQHILLMLTRMAILLLLALAFARPFARAAMTTQVTDAASKHVILVDRSYSMAADGRLGTALDEARGILRTLGADDEVAVAAFGETVDVLAPFASEAAPDGGTVAAARTALGAVDVSDEATNYAAALREAQRLLLGDVDAAEEGPRRVVHLLSDLQRTGMPDPSETWKLSPAIELKTAAIGAEDVDNFAVTDVIARRALSDAVRVVGKVKNGSSADADVVPVTLVVDGREVETIEKPIRAGNATQFSFSVPMPESGVVSGYLRLDDDAIPQDNRRYFVWSPPARHAVAMVAGDRAARDATDPATWPASWFLERGLPTGGEWPFEIRRVAPERVAGSLSAPGAASAAIVAGTSGLELRELDALRAFVADGGAALVLLDTADAASRQFAQSLGLSVQGMRFETPSEARYELLTWVGLDHPIFVGFKGHLYNDFSSLRFHQYVELAEPADETAQVLARFESGAPAMLEVAAGAGRMVVWPFSATLPATNLPKSSRFVPLLYETMRHLCRVEESESAWQVGDVLRDRDLVFDAAGRSAVTLPNGDERTVESPAMLRVAQAGFVTARPASGAGEARVEAVNVDADESDLSKMDTGEFELRMASSPRLFEAARSEAGSGAEEASVAQEYGVLLIGAVVALLLFESWYMARLTARKRAE